MESVTSMYLTSMAAILSFASSNDLRKSASSIKERRDPVRL